MSEIGDAREVCEQAYRDTSQSLSMLRTGFDEVVNNAADSLFEAIGPIRDASYSALRQRLENTAHAVGAVLGTPEEKTYARFALIAAEGSLRAMDDLPGLRDEVDARFGDALEALKSYQAGITRVQTQAGKLMDNLERLEF